MAMSDTTRPRAPPYILVGETSHTLELSTNQPAITSHCQMYKALACSDFSRRHLHVCLDTRQSSCGFLQPLCGCAVGPGPGPKVTERPRWSHNRTVEGETAELSTTSGPCVVCEGSQPAHTALCPCELAPGVPGATLSRASARSGLGGSSTHPRCPHRPPSL